MYPSSPLWVWTTLALIFTWPILHCSAFEDWPSLNQFEFTPYDPTQTQTLNGKGTSVCNLEGGSTTVHADDHFYNIGIAYGRQDGTGSCYGGGRSTRRAR